ncbi:hypothetical protein H4R19_006723, partial [Coemansia spiralis]
MITAPDAVPMMISLVPSKSRSLKCTDVSRFSRELPGSANTPPRPPSRLTTCGADAGTWPAMPPTRVGTG